MSTTQTHPDTEGTTRPDTPSPRRTTRELVAVVLGISTLLAVMLLAFVAPAVSSGPADLPLAVSAPGAAADQVTGALEETQPGAFDVTVVGSADEVRAAVRDREAVGGLAVTPDGTTVVTAGGAGTPYSSLLRGLGAGLEADGQQVTYEDVAPLTPDDPAGAGIAALGLPLIFGGMASAVLLTTRFRHSRAARVGGAVAIAALGGLVATAVLQLGFGSVDGSYWLTATSVALGIAAVSLFVLGLESLLGYAGLGLAGLLMLLVANPLSGLATGPEWLPSPWGEIGQLLPLGAAGTAVRSMAFFDGSGAGTALLVLVAWVVVGLALCFVPGRRATPAG